ncbi:hypothetical protein MASR2M70_22750 [Bacillota bacterium]
MDNGKRKENSRIKADVRAARFYWAIFYFGVAAGALVLYFDEQANRIAAGILYAILVVMMLTQDLYFNKPETARPGGKILMVAELLCALGVFYFERSLFSGIPLILIIAYTLLVFDSKFSMPYAFTAFFSYIGLLYFRVGSPELIDFWLGQRSILLPRTIIILIIISTRNVLDVNRENRQLTVSLAEKNQELEGANEQMAVYVEELEKTADMRAREQLMNELHNKLGHILATASIGVQAAAVLIDKDTSLAKVQLETAAGQIRSAMQSLRNVIIGETGFPEEAGSDYSERIRNLITETERLAGITIEHNLNELPAEELNGLPAMTQSFIYNTLMEGLTNGLSHGLADRFEFKLAKKDRWIHFRLKDNGIGFQSIDLGFGLTKIKNEAGRLGAELTITGEEGCLIEILLPKKE